MAGDERADDATVSRRGFLGWALGLGAGVVALVAGVPQVGALLASPGRASANPFVDAGNVADLPVGEPTRITFVAESTDAYDVQALPHNAWALKDGSGAVTVLSPVCTHLGCQVAWSKLAGHFVCPCHNSVFTSDGTVVSGPAPRRLDVLPSRVKDGVLSVQWVDYVPGTPAKTSV